MDDIVCDFFSNKSYAVCGSFKDESKFAYRILKMYLAKGYKVFPINPSLKIVEGLTCYKSILDIPEEVDAVSIVTPPAVTERIVQECCKKGVKYIWIQPGAESKTAVDFCDKNDIKVIYDSCVLLA